MAKNKNLIRNSTFNFQLKGRPSIFIGFYILLGTLLIQLTIEGFTTDGSPFGFLTVNYLETFIFIITLLVFLLSLLGLFFGNRRFQRKIGNKIWNRNSKKSIWVLILLVTLLYSSLFYLLRIGEEQFIISTFLIGYGFILMILNFSKTIILYLFSIASILLGFIPLFVDGTGYYSLIILGVSHFVFAYLNRSINENKI